MTVADKYQVLLFESVSYTLKTEKILKKEKIPFKLIPIPRNISSDCGMCIRFSPGDKDKIVSALSGKVEIEEIRSI